MGVDVTWKDAAEKEIEHVSDAAGWFARALNRAQNPPRNDLPIMLSIDVYGDSVVIPPRTDALAEELERVRSETAEPEARVHIGRILTLARAASNQDGSFLECTGD